MIKRIEIQNLMSHEQTAIDLAEGLTVICGPNNIGKSSVVAALQTLCYNDNSTHVLRHGERECSITVETDNGDVIQWSRKKSGGGPSYVINGEPFHRLKQNFPDKQLNEILRMPRIQSQSDDKFDLHFGEQKSPVFLLNETASTIAKFFASSSDAGQLIAMQNLHKENTRRAKRDKTETEKERTAVEEKLTRLEPLDGLCSRIDKCSQLKEQIRTVEEEGRRYRKLIRNTQSTQRLRDELLKTTSTLTEIKPPPELHDTSPLRQQVEQITRSAGEAEHSARVLKRLKDLTVPPAMKKTGQLERLAGEFSQTHVLTTHLKRTLQPLRKIQPVPQQHATAELSAIAGQIRSASIQHQRERQWNKTLAKLPAPPEIAETASLESAIKSLAEATRAVGTANKSLQTARSKMSAMNEQIQKWVRENPVCPTCGGPTQTDLICPSHKDLSANREVHE